MPGIQLLLPLAVSCWDNTDFPNINKLIKSLSAFHQARLPHCPSHPPPVPSLIVPKVPVAATPGAPHCSLIAPEVPVLDTPGAPHCSLITPSLLPHGTCGSYTGSLQAPTLIPWRGAS
eukprot:438356-Pelagomonas_calceolata.AAC.1